VHSIEEHCAPDWSQSAHNLLCNPAIKDALRIVTGCLRPTPADNLPILAGIQLLSFVAMEPHCLCQAVPWSLDFCSTERSPVHHVQVPQIETPIAGTSNTHCRYLKDTSCAGTSNRDTRRLKSRHPFVPTAQQLISSSDNNIREAQWADHQWNAEWADNPKRLRIFIPETSTQPLE